MSEPSTAPIPRTVHPQVAACRARVAGLTARGAAPNRIDNARRELRAAVAVEEIRAWAERAAAACPPLTHEEIDAVGALANRIDRRLARQAAQDGAP